MSSSIEPHKGKIYLRDTKKRGGTAVAMVVGGNEAVKNSSKNGLSAVKADAELGSFLIFCP